jgi:hypothetical protein
MTQVKYTNYGYACILGPEDVDRTYYSMEYDVVHDVEDHSEQQCQGTYEVEDNAEKQREDNAKDNAQDNVQQGKTSHKKKPNGNLSASDVKTVKKSHKKKPKGSFSASVVKTLTGYYNQYPWPDKARRIEIANALGMKYQQIDTWFGNHRHKWGAKDAWAPEKSS